MGRLSRASWIAAGMLASLIFCGLASAALKSSPPKDVDLSGRWKLNKELSEDPHGAIEYAREELKAKAKRKAGRSRRADSEEERESSRFDHMADSLEEQITTPEEFAIQQEDGAFVLVLPEATDTCKANRKDEVLVSTGAKAERQCGWDKRAFVIELKPERGPTRTERYELDKENDRLIVTNQLKGERIPEIQVKRVYERVAS
jgi:hypothetical protein